MTKNTPHTLSPAGLTLIKDSEKLCLQAYLCPANKVTIGYGHVIMPNLDAGLFNMDKQALAPTIADCQLRRAITPFAKQWLKITIEQAELLLAKDTRQSQLFIASVTHVDLTQGQFDALCSLVFNIGQGNYAQSTIRKLVNAGDFSSAAAEFDRWIYTTKNGKKEPQPGLITRRAKERALFEGL